MYRTTRPLALVAWPGLAPCAFTLPAGSRAALVRRLSGTDGDGFTVESVAQLTELTGNAHDAVHRYVGIPADAIEGDSEAEQAEAARVAAKEAAKAAR